MRPRWIQGQGSKKGQVWIRPGLNTATGLDRDTSKDTGTGLIVADMQASLDTETGLIQYRDTNEYRDRAMTMTCRKIKAGLDRGEKDTKQDWEHKEVWLLV